MLVHQQQQFINTRHTWLCRKREPTATHTRAFKILKETQILYENCVAFEKQLADENNNK